MSQAKGTITTTDLMSKLVQAKKVMNKVESGTYQKGNVNEEVLRMAPEEINQNQLPIVNTRSGKGDKVVNVEKINNSKLPDAIKKAMIENPIPQITLNDGIDMDLIKGAKKLMEREGMISKPSSKVSNTAQINHNSLDLATTLTPIIENVVRKVLDEKLTQILTAHQTQSMNENLILKVGDSIFKGKITGVNKSK